METVLLYNIAGTPLASHLKPILLKMKIRVRTVSPDQYLEPVGILAGLKNPDLTHTSPMPASDQPAADAAQFTEPMLVLSGFTEHRLDQFLLELRKKKLPPIALKAILTDQNQYWDSLTLWQELKKEHQAIQKSASET